MIVLAYLGSLCIKFHTAGCKCWFFMYFYLEWCIWPDVILWWIWKWVCIKCCTTMLAKIRQAFREESMSHTQVFRVKSMLIIFFDIKEIVHKEFILIGQTSKSIYCCYILQRLCENVFRHRPKLWQQITGCCIITMHCLTLPFSPRNLWQKTTQLSSPTHPTLLTWPTVIFLFPWLKIPPFWHKWGDRGRITSGAEYPHRSQLPGFI
jgi:hypothetical protein